MSEYFDLGGNFERTWDFHMKRFKFTKMMQL